MRTSPGVTHTRLALLSNGWGAEVRLSHSAVRVSGVFPPPMFLTTHVTVRAVVSAPCWGVMVRLSTIRS